ncbi:dUTP diphosphatase [Clostridium luticellarii]|jgi:dimeric dUTPase (all-alpha-NTP-PPase superfamily)|uniref:dUTPase n=1 Tax=Clostridium luticellarii TaxID=1691940 RepID=A0A2T0BP29_9CLOT|nr:dUTP diphosphatase [Clostridium luticellarii]MCI1944630.1 dUTP diphosphatase [Clostridium luticellarii]MCI1968129.1 dUTP diphosphatase [Clostridium luticellarii]MCI1994758.1 dUTP diphosphatase [Clostridium luticellarii]MCI2038990.1 dUTP diphosphatase [Clostridium luticellarii]PRR85634.1 dUTPase [Clostridium luticellarii]
MNLTKLFELQENLDQRIKKNISIDKTSLISKKTLALQVKMAELANETRCFNFWSTNTTINRNLILKNYINSLCFILTLGIEKGFTDIAIKIKPNEYDTTAQFLNLYIDINDFVISSSKDHYITLFEDFISLGNKLGFSLKEIENAYYNNSFLTEKTKYH